VEFGLLSYATALAAGAVSTLSPCVLPLVPIIIGSALSAHRFGVIALAMGLTLSFTTIGILIASIGLAGGFDQGLLRQIGAVILLAFGLLLLSAAAQANFAARTSGLSAAGGNLLNRITPTGLGGQLAVGLMLGVVWSPCVGPTLGAAVTLASQGSNLSQVSLIMFLFGLGAATPLVVLGLLSRQAFMRWRGKLLETGKRGKQVLGVIMLLLGTMILTGADKMLEKWITQNGPEWWIQLTTSL